MKLLVNHQAAARLLPRLPTYLLTRLLNCAGIIALFGGEGGPKLLYGFVRLTCIPLYMKA